MRTADWSENWPDILECAFAQRSAALLSQALRVSLKLEISDEFSQAICSSLILPPASLLVECVRAGEGLTRELVNLLQDPEERLSPLSDALGQLIEKWTYRWNYGDWPSTYMLEQASGELWGGQPGKAVQELDFVHRLLQASARCPSLHWLITRQVSDSTRRMCVDHYPDKLLHLWRLPEIHREVC